MVDVGAKPPARRRAVARAFVRMRRRRPSACALSRRATRSPRHSRRDMLRSERRADSPLPSAPLSHLEVRLEVGEGGVEIEAGAETTAQTGVEMEALTAATVAALTVYDMAKAIDKDMVIEDVRLLEKTKEVVS